MVEVISEKILKGLTLQEWLENKRLDVHHVSMTTHPVKYTHPDIEAKSCSLVMGKADPRADGYLRTGNYDSMLDFMSSAGYVPISNFLNTVLSDEQTVLYHLQHATSLSKKLFEHPSISYESLREAFLSVQSRGDSLETATASKLRQVYFPVQDGYHLLSILSSSSLIFLLKKRLALLNFSEEVKQVKSAKKNNQYANSGYITLKHVKLKYGGSNPVNISAANSSNAGFALAFVSIPPAILEERPAFPKYDFFKENLPWEQFEPIFKRLSRLMHTDYNNHFIRDGIQNAVEQIVEGVVENVWKARLTPVDSMGRVRTKINRAQSLWLSPNSAELVEDWIDAIINELANWIVRQYEWHSRERAMLLGEQERLRIIQIISNISEVLE